MKERISQWGFERQAVLAKKIGKGMKVGNQKTSLEKLRRYLISASQTVVKDQVFLSFLPPRSTIHVDYCFVKIK